MADVLDLLNFCIEAGNLFRPLFRWLYALASSSFDLAVNEKVLITKATSPDQPKSIIVPAEVVVALQPEQKIILADGACELQVDQSTDQGVEAHALIACTVKHRKTMNLPGIVLNMPSLTERDIAYLDGVKPELIDFVGLSFVRSAKDIAILRGELTKRSIKAGVVAKIENQEALNHMDEIIAAADAVMVARGDLGVEVPYQELTVVPIAYAARPAWVLKTWDKFVIRVPFARVCIAIGEPYQPPPGLDDTQMQDAQAELARRLHDAYKDAKRHLG